ncbi:ABC transporter ATP-binding protein [Haloglycomyces albus]|uniref:ABC transporter ATP-binding protein n=1 Tax=Haloglycomyces albus TaxID=526067 RepID=UPI00046CE37D|nr:ATP-binding cassette domain-containing protein [Haloglycomyces albus]
MTAVVEISGLRKTYRSVLKGTHHALDGLDLTVNQGEVHGFLGPNGCGKTTTLRALMGLISVNGGSMRLFGESVPEKLPSVIHRVGAVVESPQFFPQFTGRTTLSLLAKSAGLPQERVDEVLHTVGLPDQADRKIKGYSLGMRQRLAVAQALLKRPDLLILDEPANGLDPAGIHQMRELLQHLAHDKGVTVIVSSHLLSEVQQLADTMTIVTQGRRIITGPVDDIIEQHSGTNLKLKVDEDDHSRAEEVLQSLEGASVSRNGDDYFRVSGINDPSEVTRHLADGGVYLTHLSSESKNLEAVFLELTGTAPQNGEAVPVGQSIHDGGDVAHEETPASREVAQ